MPKILQVLETALYVVDLERAEKFYRDLFDLEVITRGDRLIALHAGNSTVLLLFLRGATAQGADFEGGWIPPHDSKGPSHFAFAIRAEDYDYWKERLSRKDVLVESEVTWGRGGRSMYFRDPDSHSVELVTPGVWSVW